ncbi:SycD/LcrH family type III secretion system chaperone [Candidatus Protochlamydia phocaeensis]|uniref:SycD/LcrH family type III secretion system chaperone n=1 Tax=Candidatus Protochlamydia phocaeensis TaxID=1414722 RepID=UPI0008384B53|nr:SycD/LcrH family type III secretion system chaperone [Candidatus Protochlamydia phocaeensis]
MDGNSVRQEVKTAMDNLGNIPPRAQKLVEEAAVKIKEQHLSAKEALNFTPAMMEEIYKYGFKQFQGGKYHEALKVFGFLRQLDVNQMRYSFAIAACHQYLKEYSDAAANYIICTYLDRFNPIPRFHLYDCFMKLNQPLSALRALNETIELAGLDSRYEELKAKAVLEHKAAEKIVKQYLRDNFETDPEAKKRKIEEDEEAK